MKIYSHLNLEGFTNTYIVVNDNPDVMEAIIIDPGKVTNEMINQLETNGYKLVGVLITHNHKHHVEGIRTLNKIYDTEIFGADYDVAGNKSNVLKDDGKINIANFEILYFSVPGHSSDGMVFKIENVIFTGDSICAGTIGSTTSKYSSKILCDKISEKIFSQTDDTVLMPGHGPPTTIASEKKFNIDMISKK